MTGQKTKLNKNQLWQAALAELEINLSKANFSTWFANSQITKIKKNKGRQKIIIGVPNFYAKHTIETQYLKKVKKILDRLSKKKNQVKIVVKTKIESGDTGPLFKVDYEKERQKLLKTAVQRCRLRPDFTFETFAVSSSNEMAHAAAQAVAKSPGENYHLLFLYGGVGVGKTHLTQAIGHRILEKTPSASIVYCTSEEFTNEIVSAIQTKSTRKFRKKYRQAKALLIDDIQFIGGKETIQEEFFHTFNAIHAEGGQIVLTSDRLPHEIEGLEDRLLSRFEGGLTIDVQEPNFELRTAILLIKAKQRGSVLPMDVAQLVAQKIESTRKLEGFLTRLITVSNTKKQPITPQLAKSLLGKDQEKNRKAAKKLKPKEIIQTVASYFDLKVSQLKGPRRSKPIVFPRQVAMYLIRKELKTPYIELGRMFGGRDHTTVMYSVDKISQNLPKSEDLRADIKTIKENLYQ